MTYIVPVFSTLNLLGVDLSSAGYDQPYTATASNPTYPEYPSAPFAIGTEIINSQSGKCIYATAGGAVTIGDVVAITKLYSANSITTTIAASGNGLQLGVALATLTTGQYGWMATEGVVGWVNVATATAYASLWTTTTAGRLATSAQNGITGNYKVSGIVVATANTTAGAQVSGILTNIAIADAAS